MKNLFKITAILTVLIVSTLSAKVPYNLKESKPYNGKTINILSVTTPQFKGLELRTKEFTGLTGIKVNWIYTPFSALQEKVSSVGVAANGNYDVVNFLDSWGSGYANWLLPLDKYLREDNISMSRYPQAFAKSSMQNGKVIGFPLRAHAQLLFYRKDVFKELGLKPPKTWEDLARVGKIIKREKNIAPLACYYGSDGNKQNLFIWLNFLWANNAKIFTKNMEPAWDSKKAIEATKAYIALHRKHNLCGNGATSNLEPEARLQFAQEKVAMLPVWWWAYGYLTNPKNSSIHKEDIGFVSMPSYKGKIVTYAISMPFAISKYSKNKGASWEFLKWLSNPKLEKLNATQREVAGEKIFNNVVTHNKNLLDKQVNQANFGIQKVAYKSLKNSNIMPQIQEWQEIGQLISNAIQEASLGTNVEKVMKKSAKRAKRILRRSRK